MDRYVMESRMKELIHRAQRLKRYVARKVEGSHGELEALLLENVDVTAELTELLSDLLEQQVKMQDNYGGHGFDYGEEYEGEEMFMVCPYCHESVAVSPTDMELQSTQCPHCHARLQLYSPS